MILILINEKCIPGYNMRPFKIYVNQKGEGVLWHTMQQPTVGRPLPAAVQAARGASVCIVSGTIYLSQTAISAASPSTSSVFLFIISTPTPYGCGAGLHSGGTHEIGSRSAQLIAPDGAPSNGTTAESLRC